MLLRPLQECYVEDIAALGAISEKTVRLWLSDAGACFSVATNDTGRIVGFIRGSLTAADVDPDSSTLHIQSVVVDPVFRRQGLALKMLKQYVERICTEQPQVKHIVSLVKFHLVELFIKAGFTVTGLASSVQDRLQLEFDCKVARQIPFVQVDAFTHEPFQVAQEKNLNATAFTAPREVTINDDIVEYDIKWFSPVVELTMCGHGTLSTAVALLDRSYVRPTQTIHFYNRTNVLVCRYEATTDQRFSVVMDFPCKLIATLPAGTTPDAIAAALGIPHSGVLDIQLALNDVIVRVDKTAFSALKPDFHRLADIDTGRFIVTTEASPDDRVDFQIRFFAPRIGINEDPVTGSAHCGLGPYWSMILGKNKLTGYQSTPARGGFVEINLDESQPGRVLLKCQGIVVAHGLLKLCR